MSVRATWLAHAIALGSQVVRLNAGWPAAQRPQPPTDPSDPAYDFTPLDAGVRDAAAHGLAPLLSFTSATVWAEGRRPAASASPGSWLPQPAAIQGYGQALASRYDGHYNDRLHPGAFLPRAKWIQLWNEPNLSQYQTPCGYA
jgi:hypothetical protein